MDKEKLLDWLETNATACLENEMATDARNSATGAYWFGKRTAFDELAERIERGQFGG